MLRSIVLGLGGVLVADEGESDEFAQRVTHLVVGVPRGGEDGGEGRPRRTLKVLHALLSGAWLLDAAWLRQSLDPGALLPEAPFEAPAIVRAFPAVRDARSLREAGSPIAPLADLALAISTADGGEERRLKRLAARAGASLTSVTRADVCVGPGPPPTTGRAGNRARVRVRPDWLYDSIMNLRPMPFAAYGAEAA